jgi:hypothetical protein
MAAMSFLPLTASVLGMVLLWPSQAAPVVGTYQVVICKREPCDLIDPANVQIKGHLVLADRPVTLADFPPEVQRLGSMRYRFDRAEANGCFGMAAQSLAPMTNAASGDAGPTLWRQLPTDRTRVSFSLNQSPDASHEATATIANGSLRGLGSSRGIGAAAPPSFWGDDIIVGRRIGPVDLSHCVESATRYLARIRGGFQRNAMSELPQIGTTDTAATRPATSRFVLLLSAPLLEPATPFERAGSPYRPGLFGIGRLYGEADIVTVGASGRMADAAAYAAETVARVRTLLDRGVSPSHITVMAAGASTAIAIEVARQIHAPIGMVFVGGCRSGATTTPAALALLDIVESDTADADRCSTRLGAKGAQRITLTARPRSAYASGSSAWLPLQMLAARPEDFIDAVAAWIRAR